MGITKKGNLTWCLISTLKVGHLGSHIEGTLKEEVDHALCSWEGDLFIGMNPSPIYYPRPNPIMVSSIFLF